MIKIKRDSGYADRLRAYKVILDEKVIGYIKNGQDVFFEVSKGTHQLYLKVDWCRSNKINFESNDRDIEFECGSSLRGLKMLLNIFYLTLLKNKYLWIKKI
jgi:hypothetical protein